MSSSRVTSPVPSASEASSGSAEAMPSAARRRRATARAAGALQHPHGGGVDRLRQRLLQRDLAARLAVEVARLPAAERSGASTTVSSGPPARLQRRQIDERLEGRAGLALRLDGAVELARPVVAAADHGAHRAGRGLQHHHRALADAGSRAAAVPAAPPAAPRPPPAARGRAWCARQVTVGIAGGSASARSSSTQSANQPALGGRPARGMRICAAAVAPGCGDARRPRPSRPAPRRARARRRPVGRGGLRRDGALGRPASIAACHSVTPRRRHAEIAAAPPRPRRRRRRRDRPGSGRSRGSGPC